MMHQNSSQCYCFIELFQAVRDLAHQRARLSPKAYQRDEGIVNKHLAPFFAGKLAAIRRADVQRYITERSGYISEGSGRPLSRYSLHKEINVLKHLLRMAVEWEIIPINPAQGVKAPKVPAGRVRYLQPTELMALLGACPEWLRSIAGIAVTTGMRRGEILGLRWLDLDLGNKRLILRQTKNGDGRIVYLNQTALTVIRLLPFDGQTKATDRLFADLTPEQVSMAFRRACRNTRIEDFRFHDLRHTAASWLRMSGADIHTVALLLGHKDLRMAMRYQHLSPAFLAEAVGRLDGVFGDLSLREQVPEADLRPHSVPRLPGPQPMNAGSAVN
jgi:integrase